MTTFILSVVALILGPVIYTWGRNRPTPRQMLDGFLLVTVAGLVCVYIVPEALQIGGRLAFLSLAFGLVFPIAIERTFHRSAHKAHVLVVVLAAFGLVLHALIDGIALLPNAAMPETSGGVLNPHSMLGNELALGVILHRLPVGMAIWWSVRSSFGTRAAVFSFALVIAATATAFFHGAPAFLVEEQKGLAVFQAFVAGSLVHVVAFGLHHEHADDNQTAHRFAGWGFRSGVVVGMFVLFALPYLH